MTKPVTTLTPGLTGDPAPFRPSWVPDPAFDAQAGMPGRDDPTGAPDAPLPPVALAERLTLLSPREIWTVLATLPESTQVRVFAALPDDLKASLVWMLARNRFARIEPGGEGQGGALARIVPNSWALPARAPIPAESTI